MSADGFQTVHSRTHRGVWGRELSQAGRPPSSGPSKGLREGGTVAMALCAGDRRCTTVFSARTSCWRRDDEGVEVGDGGVRIELGERQRAGGALGRSRNEQQCRPAFLGRAVSDQEAMGEADLHLVSLFLSQPLDCGVRDCCHAYGCLIDSLEPPPGPPAPRTPRAPVPPALATRPKLSSCRLALPPRRAAQIVPTAFLLATSFLSTNEFCPSRRSSRLGASLVYVAHSAPLKALVVLPGSACSIPLRRSRPATQLLPPHPLANSISRFARLPSPSLVWSSFCSHRCMEGHASGSFRR